VQRTLLHTGFMYITTTYVLFYGKFPKKEMIRIPLDDISSMEKKKTAKVINNALLIKTKSEKEWLFSGFLNRDEAMAAIEKQQGEVLKMKKKQVEDEEEKMVSSGDAMVKAYHKLSKGSTVAEEIQESLVQDKRGGSSSKCCTII